MQSDPDGSYAEHDSQHGRDQHQHNVLPVDPWIDPLFTVISRFARILIWHFAALVVFAHARQPNAMYMLTPRQATTMAIGIAIILWAPDVQTVASVTQSFCLLLRRRAESIRARLLRASEFATALRFLRSV